jgi:hypothetical protein
LGAENQRREYAKEILELKDVLRQSQEQAELLRTETNAMQDLVEQAQNSVNGRQVHTAASCDTLTEDVSDASSSMS